MANFYNSKWARLAMMVAVLTYSAQADGPAPEFSHSLSNEALFIRCYRTITRLEPDFDHPLLIQVQEEEKDPISACLEVFDQAQLFFALEPEGSGARRLEPALNDSSLKAKEARAILNNFGDFFRGWFPIKDWDMRPQYVSLGGLTMTLDMNEESIHLLRALFQSPNSGGGSQPFSNIVQGAESMMAIRTHPNRLGTDTCKSYWNQATPNCWYSVPEWGGHQGASTSPGTGDVLGIRVFPTNDAEYYTKNGTQFSLGVNATIPQTNLRAFSGGIFGTRTFLMQTSQYKDIASNGSESGATNGGRRMRRRWMKELFENLLCRKLPLLRSADVATMASEFNALPNPPNDPLAKSRLPFRQEGTCHQCHAGIDQGAAVARGLRVGQYGKVLSNGSEVDYNSDGKIEDDSVAALYFREPTLAAINTELHKQLETNNYAKTPPSGRLFYRSYDGSLVDIALDPNQAQPFDRTPDIRGDDGLAVLGHHLAQGKDLYVCAASRMIEYFTGVGVNLSDPGDPNNPPLTSDDAMFRAWAEDLALNPQMGLKASQSLRGLVERLLRSDLYKAQGFRRGANP